MSAPEPVLGSRAWFPRLACRAYVAHAAVAPVSEPSRARIEEALDDYAAHGRGAFGPWARQRDEAKALFARLIGARAEDIACVQNTAHGLQAVAWSIPWRAGERIAVVRGEYPTNVSVWQRVASRFDLELSWLDAADFAAEAGPDFSALDRALAQGVRLVAASEVQFQSGLRMPITAIVARAHAAGAEVCVDAIQAAGVVPIDVAASGVDYMACGGHKWLCGLEGAGFLYVREACMSALDPAFVGMASHEDGLALITGARDQLRYDRELVRGARVFEGGTQPVLGYAAIEPSLKALLALGIDAIHAHVQRYLDRIEAPLVERGFRSLRMADAARRSGILSFEPPTGIETGPLVAALHARGVVASSPDAMLRIAPHWPNGLDETDHVVESILAAAQG